MKHRRLLIVCILLVLAITGGILGFRAYNAQFVEIGEAKYEKVLTELDFSGGEIPPMEVLKEFVQLEKLDLRATDLSAQDYDTLCREFPGCTILWDVPFQGQRYPEDTEALKANILSQEDIDAMGYFPKLAVVDATGCEDHRMIMALREQRPDLKVDYQVTVSGETYPWDTAELALPGMEVQALMGALPYLTEMKSIRLEAPLPPAEELQALREAYPEISFYWELEFKDMVLSTETEKLNLTKMAVTVEEMDALIPYLPSLTYVDMTDCGISNEEMDALNRRHENVKIVWTIRLAKGHRLRTDIVYYMPYQDDYWPMYNELDNLRYCTDIICLDLGHMEITNCDFVAYMPHLKYLILAETKIRSIEPLRDLKELVYLELFRTHVKDYTPLTTLTALEDLNICYTYPDPEIIAQITWLKNLWWMRPETMRLSDEDQKMLQEAMPDCHIQMGSGASSTAKGWRELKNYYDHRDIMGMPYMTK